MHRMKRVADADARMKDDLLALSTSLSLRRSCVAVLASWR